MTMMMPIVQFSLLDDFVDELWMARYGCVRVWPATWQRGQGHVARVWRGVVCQAVLDDEAGRPHSVAMVSLTLGSFEEVHGRPFGPDAERRREVVERWERDALLMVERWLVERLPLGTRVARGMVYTGLRGSEIQPAFDEGFEMVYTEVRGANEDD